MSPAVRTVDQISRELRAAHTVRDMAKRDAAHAVYILSLAEVHIGELLDEYLQVRDATHA